MPQGKRNAELAAPFLAGDTQLTLCLQCDALPWCATANALKIFHTMFNIDVAVVRCPNKFDVFPEGEGECGV